MAAGTRDSGSRQDTFELIVHIGGNTFGVWDKKTGGELDSDDVKYYPGAMGDVMSLGGRLNPGNVILQRLYDRDDDHGQIGYMLGGVGHMNCTVQQRPIDQFGGSKHYNPVIWTGVLKRVQVPDVDSESTSAALIEIEISTSGSPTKVTS